MAQGGRLEEAPYRPGYETVAVRVLQYIAQSGLAPGDRLPTGQELSAQFGVGRTVLSEAMRILTAMGRVRARRGSGFYVAAAHAPPMLTGLNTAIGADPQQMAALYEFRRLQEVQTATLAAERITVRELRLLEENVALYRHAVETGQQPLSSEADAAFHQAVARAAHNPFFASTVEGIFQLQQGTMKMLLDADAAAYAVSVAQHEAIYLAIREGQSEAAAAAMAAHVQSSRANYEQLVRQRLARSLP